MNVWMIRVLCVLSFGYLALTFPFMYFEKGIDPVQRVDIRISELQSSLTSANYVALKKASSDANEYTVKLRDGFFVKQRVAHSLGLFFSLMCFSLSFKLRSGSLVFKRST